MKLPENDIIDFCTEINTIVEKVFKKYTKTEFDVGDKKDGPGDQIGEKWNWDLDARTEILERELNMYRLQHSALTDKELLSECERKTEQLGLILKNIQSMRKNITSSASKTATLIYSTMFRKLEGGRNSSENGIDTRFESSVKDISSIHTIRAKHSISTLNYLCNSMISMSTAAIGQYADDKKKTDLQTVLLRSGFECRQPYEAILDEIE